MAMGADVLALEGATLTLFCEECGRCSDAVPADLNIRPAGWIQRVTEVVTGRVARVVVRWFCGEQCERVWVRRKGEQ
jgi:hypothetical protein